MERKKDFGLKCFYCHEEGHYARECPQKSHNKRSEPKESKSEEQDIKGNSVPPQIIDIGFNMTNFRFKSDLENVVKRAIQAGVNPMIITGTNLNESTEAVQMASKRPGILYCTVGIHPHAASTVKEDTIKSLRKLASNKEVVAIGETGLDFYRMLSPREVQENSFEKHIELAIELKKPLFLHERDSHVSFMKIIQKHRANLGAIVVHCFTGKRTEVEAYLKLDLHIGFTGVITHQERGKGLRAILKSKIIPLNRLMIETDAPFMTPANMENAPKRNEPSLLPYVLKIVAECYGESEEQIALETTKTARAFFNLP